MTTSLTKKSPDQSTRPPLDMVGRCFIIWADDGQWQYQGIIRGKLEDGHYLCQFFSAFDGSPTDLAVFPLSAFLRQPYRTPGSFMLFEDDEHLRSLIDARVDLDRAEALLRCLEIRHGESLEREASEALTAEREAAVREGNEVAQPLRRDYPRLAGQLTSLITRLRMAEEAIEVVNGKLAEAGREDERIPAIEHRADALPFPSDSPYVPDPKFNSIRHSTLRQVAGIAPGYFRGVIAADLTDHAAQHYNAPDGLRR